MKDNIYALFLISTSIIGFLLLSIGFSGLLDNYKSYNIYLVLIGIILLIPYLLIFLKVKKFFVRQSSLEEDRIDKLIKTGKRVELDLKNVPVKTNSYLQEVKVGHGRNERIEMQQVHHNVLIFYVQAGNEKSAYKVDVFMEPEKLKIKLLLQEKTYIYFDAQDSDNYYIDLSFLDEK